MNNKFKKGDIIELKGGSRNKYRVLSYKRGRYEVIFLDNKENSYWYRQDSVEKLCKLVKKAANHPLTSIFSSDF